MLNAINQEEKKIYRILAQREHITITAETSDEVIMEEAEKIAVTGVIGGIDKLVGLKPYVLLPITTKERWDEGKINFCPRCGANISDYDLDEGAFTDCSNCEASIEVYIQLHNVEED